MATPRLGAMSTTDDVLELVQQVASDLVTPRFRALAAGEVDQKNPGDFVTVADREAEVALTAALGRMFPGAVVVGEEACFADPSREFTLGGIDHAFTVDPVDGTRNFVNGSPDHAVMVAEVVRGEQARAWIWQPEHGRAFVAERGAGVELNGARLQPVPRDGLPRGATSRARRHGFDGGGALAAVTRTAWCCGIDYPRLLLGDVDYLVYQAVHPWDHLPGSLMVTELGGAVRQFDGTDYRPGFTGSGLLAAATPAVWDTVRDAWGDPGS